MSEPRISRRGALAGAAWSAPVVLVAGAVPAFAASGAALLLNRGGSAAVLSTDGSTSFYDLDLVGLSVVVPTALTAGQLTLTVTFAPAVAGGPADLAVLEDLLGWTVTPGVGDVASTVTFVLLSAVPAGTEVQVPSGLYVGSQDPASDQTGTFVVTASAPGLTPDTQAFTTGTAAAGRSTRAVVRRPGYAG